MAIAKNIKIQIWTDLYYAKFIAIWRPEEEPDYVPPEVDPRPEQERNVPVLLVLDCMYKGRREVVGNNPVSPSQHPMPPDFLKKQVRHISYCFANEYGTFQPPTKAAAETFLAKMRVGYTMVKELKVTVSPAQGSMTLKQFRDSLVNYTEEQLQKIKVRTLGEHPEDAYAKKLEDFIHTTKSNPIEQYITVTKLVNVYDTQDTVLSNGVQITPETIASTYPPGTEHMPVTQGQIAATQDVIATNEADVKILKTAEEMMRQDTAATPIINEPTREEVQLQTIKNLQSSPGQIVPNVV